MAPENPVHPAQSVYRATTFEIEEALPHMRHRLGKFVVGSKFAIPTPSYIAVTSRGTIPHITQDLVERHTAIAAVYVGLEDFIEKHVKKAPIFRSPVGDGNRSVLRDFAGIPDQCLTILGPRRIPKVPCPQHNTNDSLAIHTSAGFANLEVAEYIHAVDALQPDITVAIADVVQTEKIGRKRNGKSVERTHAWLRNTINNQNESKTRHQALLASILPLEAEQQSFYLSDVGDEYKRDLAGLCLHDPDSIGATSKLSRDLPRLLLSNPKSPQEVLHAVSQGCDLITVPFVTTASEAGIALIFEFEDSKVRAVEGLSRESLGIDMWSAEHATDVSPLKVGCSCYTCTRHHRAYIHHLLQAKEMLAWSLLQIHNFFIIDQFFSSIQASISQGVFDANLNAFNQQYESQIPRQTGQGPRIRGYQMKSTGGGEPQMNSKAYGRLEEHARKVEEAKSGIATPADDVSADELQQQGFAEKL